MLSEFVKEKVFWTRKMNLKLVEFIKSKPNIWNPKHPKYTSIVYRDRTYAEFASKYGDEFTGQAVKERWTNIRSTFANYLRKLRASRARGTVEAYKISWHLWEPCRFLLSINKKSTAKSISDLVLDEVKIHNTEDEECNNEEASLTDQSIEEDTTCQNIANGILNVFKGVQNDVFGIESNKYSQIGRIVAEKLSQMDSYEAAQMSSKVMDVLLLYHESNPLNPNNYKVENL